MISKTLLNFFCWKSNYQRNENLSLKYFNRKWQKRFGKCFTKRFINYEIHLHFFLPFLLSTRKKFNFPNFLLLWLCSDSEKQHDFRLQFYSFFHPHCQLCLGRNLRLGGKRKNEICTWFFIRTSIDVSHGGILDKFFLWSDALESRISL